MGLGPGTELENLEETMDFPRKSCRFPVIFPNKTNPLIAIDSRSNQLVAVNVADLSGWRSWITTLIPCWRLGCIRAASPTLRFHDPIFWDAMTNQFQTMASEPSSRFQTFPLISSMVMVWRMVMARSFTHSEVLLTAFKPWNQPAWHNTFDCNCIHMHTHTYICIYIYTGDTPKSDEYNDI